MTILASSVKLLVELLSFDRLEIEWLKWILWHRYVSYLFVDLFICFSDLQTCYGLQSISLHTVYI